MILILAGPDDPQAARVEAEVRARGGAVLRVDAPAFPERETLSIASEGILISGRALPIPGAVYVRALGWHPLSPGFAGELKARPHGLVAQCDEKRAVLESLLLILQQRGATLVNPPEVDAQHGRKPLQLHLLEAAGLPVPAWTATNDPAMVRRFVRSVKEAVYKPVAGGARVQHVVREDLTQERLSALALAPVLFQEFVRGTPVRAYVVNGRVVGAAAIFSESVDYRGRETGVEAVRLSREERAACVRAARTCHMPFTGVDLIRARGRFVVLECNPSPMFAGFEQAAGLDIAGPLAAFLVRMAAKRPKQH